MKLSDAQIAMLSDEFDTWWDEHIVPIQDKMDELEYDIIATELA